ncbi:pirin family protein [Chryseolinea lacunae]|uniref:Pirin family protein n=1 Tax=Chryseolinea lacunae TaxID=2801331 RepID=A0ABS1L2V6_9BACT|nr:pirin family protein [Chryseolinea lacunae]MBL0744876.1 pirin family protein [Chryseolinea lacunae]
MKSITRIHTAHYQPIADLVTYTAMPAGSLEHIDPFLLLNHHGHQVYSKHNHGLPFGPHPHRGMETVTFILEGDIMHRDSGGHESVIESGGVQWMTAGSGLIHAETSSDRFRSEGGPLEILQLWLNLPGRLKMTAPKYTGLQKDNIPSVALDNGNVTLNMISGNWQGNTGAFTSLTGIALSTVYFKAGGKLNTTVPADENILFYVIRGSLKVNEATAETHQLVEFGQEGDDQLAIEATDDSTLLFGHGAPLHETIVAQGPFVMNTAEEIAEAYSDYREGKFGTWG